MWKRLLETTKQAAAASSPKSATPAAAAPKPATPAAAAAPKLSTLKSPSSSRRAAVTPATAVSQASLLRLKHAAASKKTTLPSSLPHAQAHAHDEEEPPHALTKALMSVLDGPDDIEESWPSEAPAEDSEDAGNLVGKKILDIEWFVAPPSRDPLMHWRREAAREKKKQYIFKNTESRRFTKLMRTCADKLGAELTLEFFEKLGRDNGVKEFNALIRVCLDKARACRDIDSAVEHIYRAYNLFEMMRDRGLRIEQDIYGPFLLYLVEVGLSEEFEMFSTFFKDANPQSYSRIAYYEMLLCIRVQNEEKIQELCHSVEDYNEEAHYDIAESYMLAFAESGRKRDLIALLELLDLTKVSGSKYISSIFKSLGRLELEKYAEKLLQGMRSKESAGGNISSLIFDYAANIPNIMVEDIVVAFHKWHEKFEVAPSIAAYDRIISICCNSSMISLALDVADCMCKSNSDVPIESFHPIIQACEQRYELHMVHPIYDLIRRHKLKLKIETFRSIISSFVKMKDFEGAYKILIDAEESGEISTISLYNAIMLGYYREKNHSGAQMVMAQMQIAGVKPDSETFSYLIVNCESEENISKYRDQLRQDVIPMTRHIYMALVNAYSRLGNFDMAKQILLDKEIPRKYLKDIKSALVTALASNGQVLDALSMYDEIKQSGSSLEPKAAIALIENIRTEGELDRMRQLLEELSESNHWFEGCGRVLLYCVQHNHPDAAIDILKQLKAKDEMSTYMVVDQVFGQIWDMEATNLDLGMELLHAVKELGLNVSRTSLDFLLSACVKAKDSQRAQQIWTEYESAGLRHNVLTFLRMYQALSSSGRWKAAKKLLKEISKEDDHVRYIIDSCHMTYYSEEFKPPATIRFSSKKSASSKQRATNKGQGKRQETFQIEAKQTKTAPS
ncbi:pentatricopeptide repeat-containing protein At4g04790, mitochondrial-like isoform X2 [Phragmites australis]|uniref:pentatricopeptide repeat-containing protein At4g04790, mitochondrial-like isoform X2 n=1 Tax=Phragmites australis TaxID=29695 RepID=UPI002D76AEE4|nr:pentatricopeptide repeat-containing protein At4g04790, mitochondrial-like isoform X2 [Phragmites australis]